MQRKTKNIKQADEDTDDEIQAMHKAHHADYHFE